ncbi:MAG TPA: tRNA (guanosine(37)-N1)-methyltransferase TrmD [Gemmatimonadota bacterium]|nr:tRNA (guanosine(37)-N1)-methyltransferase TrmD [Gemmatimonadota bacterium]
MTTLHVNILTLFPAYFREPLAQSMTGRARRLGVFSYDLIDLRDFVADREQVDDYPYGGGGGMVLKPEPVFRAHDALGSTAPFILLSARGRPFTHKIAVELSVEREVTLLCGHYKDVDERVREALVTDEISLGDFVLSGGEIAALAVLDAVVRLLPGVLGDFDSAQGDSFHDEPLLGSPSYTRPAVYRGLAVPEVLRSGDHGAIARWRREQSERATRRRRPDLMVELGGDEKP